MFINSDIPSNYKYVYKVSDNFISLTNKSNIESGDTYKCYNQYLSPSWLYIETNEVATCDNTLIEINEFSDSYYARADMPTIFIASMILLLFILFIYNCVTKLVVKGGLFFGK